MNRYKIIKITAILVSRHFSISQLMINFNIESVYNYFPFQTLGTQVPLLERHRPNKQ